MSGEKVLHHSFKRSCPFLSWIRSHILFGAFFPVIFNSTKRHLTFEDLSPLTGSLDIKPWIKKFEFKVQKELERINGPRRYASAAIIFSLFWPRLLLLTFLNALTIAARAVKGTLLRYLIQQLASSLKNARRPDGVTYMVGIVLLEAAVVIVDPHIRLWSRCLSLRIEKILTSSLFERSLHYSSYDAHAAALSLSVKDSKRSAQSNAYTLLAVDAANLATAILYTIDVSVTIISFLMLACSGGFWGEVEIRIASTTLFILALIVIGLELLAASYQRFLLNYRDVRLGLCRNAVMDMRTLQMLNWTQVVADDLNVAREEELKVLKLQTAVTYLSSTISQNLGALTCIAFLTTFFLLESRGVILVVATVFAVQVTIRDLTRPVTHLGRYVQGLSFGCTSCLRFESYLFASSNRARRVLPSCLPENDKEPATIPQSASASTEAVCLNSFGLPFDTVEAVKNEEYMTLDVQNATFTWVPERCETSDNTVGSSRHVERLEDYAYLNCTVSVPFLQLQPSECVMVTGISGSGKTSLLLALLGEMAFVEGSVKWRSSGSSATTLSKNGAAPFPVGYVGQNPWIPAGTVRDAILFGRPLDMKRYQAVLDACQLEADIASWPSGDQWIMADGALNLSGGQRVRLALARAVYGEAESRFCLFDQPFDSIDPAVGRIIFDKLFSNQGLLSGSTTIMTVSDTNAGCLMNYINKKQVPYDVTFSLRSIRAGVLDPTPQHTSETPAVCNNLLTDPNQAACSPVFAKSSTAPPPVAGGCPYTSAIMQACCQASATADSFNDGAFYGTRPKESLKWYIRRFGSKTALCVCLLCFLAKLLGFTALFLPAYSATRAEPQSAQPRTTSRSLRSLTDLASLSPVPWAYLPSRFRKQHTANERSGPLEPALPLASYYMSDDEKDVASLAQRVYPNTPENSTRLVQSGTAPQKELHQRRDLYSNEATVKHSPAPPSSSQRQQLYIYITVSLASVATLGCSMLLQACGLLKAARAIHEKLVEYLVRTHLWFFNFISAGVIINRFAVDLAAIDLGLSITVFLCVGLTCQSIILVAALCLLSPYTSVVLVIVGIIVYLWTKNRYIPANKELQRLKLASLSPVSSLLSDAENASITIRAFHQQAQFRSKNSELIGNLMQAEYAAAGTSAWLYIRQRLILLPFITLVAFSPYLIYAFHIPNGGLLPFLLSSLNLTEQGQIAILVGFSVSQAFSVPDVIAFTLCQWGELQYRLCSVQRVCDLLKLMESGVSRPRGDHPELSVVNLPAVLPLERTGLTLNNAVVSYVKPTLMTVDNGEKTDLVLGYYPATLQGISAHASPGDTIGVVGRTGSGKTTLLLALLNKLPILSGSIQLDGVPVSLLPDEDITKVIGVLPQALGSTKGWTVRKLLDPHNLFPLAELQKALAAVDMLHLISSLPDALNTVICQDPHLIDASRTVPSKKWFFDAPGSTDPNTAIQRSPSQLFSPTQLRRLMVARLCLNANTYRLIIVDEPPPLDTASLGGDNHDSSHPQSPSQDSALKAANNNFRSSTSIPNMTQLLKSLFPNAIHLVIAHHASAINGCDRLWILAKGRLRVRACDPKTTMSQETLIQLLQEAEMDHDS